MRIQRRCHVYHPMRKSNVTCSDSHPSSTSSPISVSKSNTSYLSPSAYRTHTALRLLCPLTSIRTGLDLGPDCGKVCLIRSARKDPAEGDTRSNVVSTVADCGDVRRQDSLGRPLIESGGERWESVVSDWNIGILTR